MNIKVMNFKNSDFCKLPRQFSKFNNLLWVGWFLCKNLSNFVSLVLKLHNWKCHKYILSLVELCAFWKYITGMGAVQKLHGQDFDHFWLPTYLDVDISYPKHGQKAAFFDHLPTSSYPSSSFWTTPNTVKPLMIADRMIPPLGQEYSHGKTQYIPGKQVLVRSWPWIFFSFILHYAVWY